MIKIFFCVFILSSAACATGITVVTENYDRNDNSAIKAKIVIDLNKTGQYVDKKFYGAHLDSNSPIPAKEFIDELQLGKLRVGGNEYDVFNWKTNKSATQNGETKTINGFEYLASTLKRYNVDGIFQINLTGYQPELVNKNQVIKRTFTSQSAYEMVKHLNGDLGLNIVDFSLGNEFSIWHETHAEVWPTKDGISADEYIDRYIDFALAIRKAQKEVDGNPNSIKIWGPEISSSWLEWNTGNFSKDCAWTDIPGQVDCAYGNSKFDHFIPYFLSRLTLAEKNKKINPNGYKLLDYLSIHYYPNFRTKISDPNSIITNEAGRQLVAEILESTRIFHDPSFVNTIDVSSFKKFRPNILGRIKDWMRDYYSDAKLVMNEFAVDSDYRSTGYHSIIRPLYLADAVGIFSKEDVAFLNVFILNSGKGSAEPWAMLSNGTERQNTYYMYKLFSNYFKGKVLMVSDNMGDVVNTYATLGNEYINLAIVNKDPISNKVQIYVKNDSTRKVITYLVPGWSVSILKIDKEPVMHKKDFEIYQYGAREMGIPLDSAYAKNIK